MRLKKIQMVFLVISKAIHEKSATFYWWRSNGYDKCVQQPLKPKMILV